MVSSVPRKLRCAARLLVHILVPQMNLTLARPYPSVQGLLGRRDDARVVGQAQIVVRAEVEHLRTVRDTDTRPLRADDDALGLEQASRADLVKLAADLLPDAGKHLPDSSRSLLTGEPR